MQRILGHANFNTTLRYTHLTREGGALSADKIDVLMTRFRVDWGDVVERGEV